MKKTVRPFIHSNDSHAFFIGLILLVLMTASAALGYGYIKDYSEKIDMDRFMKKTFPGW